MNCLSIILGLVLGSLASKITDNINAVTMDIMPRSEESDALAHESIFGYYNTITQQTYYLRALPPEDIVSKLCNSIQENGSWPDIDYWDPKRSSWSPMKHAVRVQTMAIVWKNAVDKGLDADLYLQTTLKAMRYWFNEMPVCRNWWYNEIGIPKIMGPAFLLLKDHLSDSDVKEAIRVMSKAKLYRTGSNAVWLAGNVIVTGILKNDEALIRQAGQVMADWIIVTDKEGVQEDYSFHQHGSQPQFGNYGMAYASILAYWARIFRGTPLEFKPESMDLIYKFIRGGLSWPAWNGYYDQNANGRQVFKDTQKKNYHSYLYVKSNLEVMGMDFSEQYGAKYFWRSDFGVYKTQSWYASIRMQSSQVNGFEMTNSENISGYFCSDGALLILKDGDEYYNISPVWNWRHIPGTTTYDDKTELNGCNAKFPFNKSRLVCGLDDSDGNMVAAMQYDRDGLKADKVWFFWEGGIMCLGSGIGREGEDKVTTAIEQCNVKGPIEEHRRWYRHNGITYIRMDGNKFCKTPLPHSGSWGNIAHFYDRSTEERDLFEIYIDHGTNVRNASYAYGIVPDSDMSGNRTGRKFRRDVVILNNGTDNQVIYVKSKGLLMFASWDGSKIKAKIPGLFTKKLDIPVSAPCSGIFDVKTGRYLYAEPLKKRCETTL